MTKMLILAQSPKTERNVKEPLRGTRSWTILKRWMDEAGVKEEDVVLLNAYDEVGKTNFCKSVMKRLSIQGKWNMLLIKYPVIVCLGEHAKDAIAYSKSQFANSDDRWHHFFIPHPSGLNRKLNDPAQHERCVTTLKVAHEKLLTLKS